MRKFQNWAMGVVGALIVIVEPFIWIIDRLAEVDFVASHLGVLGIFLASGYGTLTTVLGGCGLIAFAIYRGIRDNKSSIHIHLEKHSTEGTTPATTEAKRITHDVWLQDAVLYALYGRWFAADELAFPNPGDMERGTQVAIQMREMAGRGDFLIWGRESKNHLYVLIPPEFWVDQQIDIFHLLGDEAENVGTEEAAFVRKSGKKYQALKVSKIQVEAVWPALVTTQASADRIPVVSFIELARKRFGWDFDGNSMDPLDLELGMLQAAADGTISFFGRDVPEGISESLFHQFVLVKIPSEHFQTYRINSVGYEDNKKTKTYAYISGGVKVRYRDLQISRIEGTAWLQNGAHAYRGITVKAKAS